MDPKASAKSKRSHTQHGRRTHLPPAAVAHKKKAAASAAAVGDKTASTHRGLPSNWDRYDDADCEGADTTLGTKQSDDGEVAPKSKGADFGFLIEQARSQPKDFGPNGSQGSSSFDEFSFDVMRGMSSMLSVRGKGLLSLCSDDNFIVDDDPTSSSEVPFLSMDLHALSAQLSKLKLSQRLFIEADLLPEELSVEESNATLASKKQDISEPAEFDSGFDSQDLHSLLVLENNAISQTGNHSMLMEAEVNLGAGVENDKLCIPPLHSTDLEASKSSKQIEQCSRREVEEPSSQMLTCTISDSEQKKTTRFEATAAEEELDMLLDSFSETSLSSSKPASLINETSALKSSNFGFIAPDIGRSMSQYPDSSPNSIPTSSIDDSIDGFLAETSLPLHDQMYRVLPQKGASFPQISPLGSVSTNAYISSSDQVMSESMADSIADSIDDLLAETSVSLKEHKHAANQQIKGLVSSSKGLPPQNSSMSSKALDDFDSWLDTL